MKKHLLLTTISLLIALTYNAQVFFGNGSNGNPSIGPNTIVNSYKKIQSVSGSTITLINNTGFSTARSRKIIQ